MDGAIQVFSLLEREFTDKPKEKSRMNHIVFKQIYGWTKYGKKEGNPAICNNKMNLEDIKQNKPDTEGQIFYDFT